MKHSYEVIPLRSTKSGKRMSIVKITNIDRNGYGRISADFKCTIEGPDAEEQANILTKMLNRRK